MNPIKNIFVNLLFLSILCTLSGCDKEKLDFESDQYFGIKALLNSENCNADCGETADCEGKQVKVRGKLDSSNINEEDHQFYLIDEDKDNFRLEVRVTNAINADVFQKLNGNGGHLFRVEGEIEGYDASTNATCKRQFLLRLNEVSKIE